LKILISDNAAETTFLFSFDWASFPQLLNVKPGLQATFEWGLLQQMFYNPQQGHSQIFVLGGIKFLGEV